METNTPKYSDANMAIRNNYYVVHREGRFHYFPIKVKESTEESPLLRFSRRPPLLATGHVILARELYRVDTDDILRGIIRKNKKVSGDTNGRSRSAAGSQQSGSDTETTSLLGRDTGSDLAAVESGAQRDIVLEVSAAADLAIEEQARALLEALHQEEGGEWEIADSAQP